MSRDKVGTRRRKRGPPAVASTTFSCLLLLQPTIFLSSDSKRTPKLENWWNDWNALELMTAVVPSGRRDGSFSR